MYATLTDINVHLPADKAQISDGEDDSLQIDAYRLIRSYIGGAFGTDTIESWLDPDLTPEFIRQIAGRLIAAKFYSNLVAEDEADGSDFARELYESAIADLVALRDGTLTLIGVDGEPIENSDLVETSFWPNDTTQPSFFAVADEWS